MKNSDESSKSRREFLKKSSILAIGGIGVISSSNLIGSPSLGDSLFFPPKSEFTLPPLGYEFNALEPYIDAKTMEIHYTKHHQAYVNNLNKAMGENNILVDTIDELLRRISAYPATVRNNAGGHYNHSLFWELMKPSTGGTNSGKAGEALISTFGSLENFMTKFSAAGMGRFGSGWAWLAVSDGKLVIGSTPNQDNPLMDNSEFKGTPILALDVWEHAYYLQYQNRRADYIAKWWNTINWNKVNELFSKL